MNYDISPKEHELRSRMATIVNLERPGKPEYDGRKATAAATSAS
jgi:hypothetical protein